MVSSLMWTPAMTKAKAKPSKTADQLSRFRDMAREVGADTSPGALDRAFGKVKAKKPSKTK
jgi:hypothetical protein